MSTRIKVEKVDNKAQWRVKTDGRVSGHINYEPKVGFWYQPKGSKTKGEVMPSLDAVIRSLGDEE